MEYIKLRGIYIYIYIKTHKRVAKCSRHNATQRYDQDFNTETSHLINRKEGKLSFYRYT